MCWVCDPLVKNNIAMNHWADVLGLEVAHFEAMSKGEMSFPADGVGGDKGVDPTPVLVVTTDDVGDGTASAGSIAVGEHIVSTIDTVGDQDFFAVQLEAGKNYQIGQYAETGGPSGTPLADAFIEIYDADGKLIVSADGGGPNTPSGLDALLSFIPETSGTYFINARAYDNESANGTTGDFVGDYELFVELAPEGAYVYTPYYDVDSPLYALDWGTQVDGSSRNPDGEEGPRVTGNEETGYAYNPYGIEGKTVITYYYARQGDTFVSEDPANPGLENTVAAGFRDFEKEAFESAMAEFSEVADVVFVEVATREEADFKFITYDGTPNAGVLGRMSPPDTANEGQAEFNRNGPGWTEENLVRGGFSWVTLTHELGHGMGMAHPHDNGGRSGIMRGVEPEGTAFDYTTGDFNLNQGIFTMMSYEDGWQTSPYGNAATSSGYGYNGSLAAFDIAVIQDKYGVNEDTRIGDDIYVMKDVNASGTYYESIWDAGGTDAIVYGGDRNASVDLRDASLQYEEGGGGFVSYAFGIFGGFTIANAVVIENARTGNGNDRITGNNVDNILLAGAGNDFVTGLQGDDMIDGGNGADRLLGGFGSDLIGGGEGDDFVDGGVDNDQVFGGVGNDDVRGGAGSDRVIGGDGADVLYGNLGADMLLGGLGRDRMFGGDGADTFAFSDGETGDRYTNADRIADFTRIDTIDLTQVDAIAGAGNDAFTFVGTAAFSGTAGELRYHVSSGNALVAGDLDGDRVADFMVVVENIATLTASDFNL